MTSLYSIAEVVAATGGCASGTMAGEIGSISIDSREIGPGALFVAIKGENFDGHDFVRGAIEAGAAAALVSRDRAEGLGDLPLIVVEDALEGLYALARFNRARSSARIVAVTGSVGKTSTKEAIRVALEACGKTHASIRSFNNHWGVPLMLARMPLDTRFGVFEIGMSSAGEITPLSRLVAPHAAVITTVAPAHLAFFASLEAIADAKAEIFDGVVEGGRVILGHDHGYIERLRAGALARGLSPVTYGYADAADVRIGNYVADGEGGRADVGFPDGVRFISVAARGRHVLANGVAALLAVEALGGDFDRANAALARHHAPEGRGAAFTLGDGARPLRLIDESYNANPTSMLAALDVFSRETPAGRKILVLGDMRELGAQSGAYHAGLAGAVIDAGPEKVFLVGEHMKALAAALPAGLVVARAQQVDEIAQDVLQALAPGDSVMVKGSNGLKLGTLVARIRARFGAPD